jgi:hypothetical protein
MHAQYLVLIPVGLPPDLLSYILVADASMDDVF